MERGCAQPINIVAEIDVRKIAFEDFILGQPRLEPERDQHFAGLARQAALGRQKGDLGKLLGDRAATLRPAAAHIVQSGADNAARIDPPMRVETPVFDCDKGLGHMRRQLRHFDRLGHDRAVAGKRLTICGEQGQLRWSNGLERLGKRRRQDQPDKQQDEHDRRSNQPALDPDPPLCAARRRRNRRNSRLILIGCDPVATISGIIGLEQRTGH